MTHAAKKKQRISIEMMQYFSIKKKSVPIVLPGQNLSLLHTSDVSAIASARTFTLEHKRRKRGGLYLALTIALTFCRFTLKDF